MSDFLGVDLSQIAPPVPQDGPEPGVGARLDGLRRMLAERKLDAWWLPSEDPYLNEYVPPHLARRAWLTGFDGSAGDCLVTRDRASLLTDSRYHLQAESQLEGSGIMLIKSGEPGAPSAAELMTRISRDTAGKGLTIGYDPHCMSLARWRQFERLPGISWQPLSHNPVDTLWEMLGNRPQTPNSEVYPLPLHWAGEPVANKLARMRADMTAAGAAWVPLVKLDQIAWLFNLRGADIPHNPVFLAEAFIGPENSRTPAVLFIDPKRLNPEAKAQLDEAKVLVLPPDQASATFTQQLWQARDKSVLLGDTLANRALALAVESVSDADLRVVPAAQHPVEKAKAVKNPRELQAMKRAGVYAGRSVSRALWWLGEQPDNSVTEASFAALLEEYYADEPDFKELSFPTIAGYGANGAIVHYSNPSPDVVLEPGKLFLVDSGAQYLGGTTDATRTAWMGKVEPDAETKRRYTTVLKAHIALASAVFPEGTSGSQLEGIVRAPLWQAGLDYGHGTGHGVGAFLNVHEGPCGIHRRADVPLQPGHVISIEPGMYETGWGGIRLENLYVVVDKTPDEEKVVGEKKTNGKNVAPPRFIDGRKTLGFETLTWIPFYDRLTDRTMLSKEELAWLDAYHADCEKTLTADLDF